MLNNVPIVADWSKAYNSLTKISTATLSYLRPYPATASDPVETVVSACVELWILAASWSFPWNTMSNYIKTHLINWKVVSIPHNCYTWHCDRCTETKYGFFLQRLPKYVTEQKSLATQSLNRLHWEKAPDASRSLPVVIPTIWHNFG